jgi:hypothetical protein
MSQNTHEGGCHCGQVRYKVDLDLTAQMVTCNCSMCGKSGAIMAFVPADAFTLLSGESALKDYQFNTKNIHHKFCTECGVRSFAHGTGPDGKPMVSGNVRCIDDVDLGSLKTMSYDGKST